ncbi:response regulator [Caballeronia hypogeia]|nr:response regulator [Caballeronia hypogeia]
MTHDNKITIAVADDRPVVLRGLQSWLESDARFRVLSCARNAQQLLACLSSAGCDLIVLGCSVEAASADDFALLRELRHAYPETPVIALTDETRAVALAQIQRNGAAGLLSSHDKAHAFERVCDRVLSGARNVVSPCIAASLSATTSDDPAEESGRVNPGPDYSGARVSVTQFVARALDDTDTCSSRSSNCFPA